ncbi:MAG: hypothetical protein LC789_10235 [Actinobacteria bacterium]|nr:hypothetical protein [Actinomycetota bacterium]MCA1721103.1 hypothetical protein [Actinomycetota bacterium]
MTTLDAPPVIIEGGTEDRPTRSGPVERVPALRPLSPVPTYLGIAVAAIGFVLVLVAWGQSAGETNVARQIPYLISGGMVGLGMIMVGVTVVNVAAKRRDALLREQQTGLLASALRELSSALDPDGRR